MPPVAYTGALQPKKKSELQEIAIALRLSDQGTKDEIQNRIKRHLDNNQLVLEEDPVFAGLFGRRKRSVQPTSQPLIAPPPSTRFAPPVIDAPAPEKSTSRSSHARRITPMDPIRESTPVKDLRDVSTFLKNPFSPVESTPGGEDQQASEEDFGTPSSLPPLPPSPTKSIIEHLPKPADIMHRVKMQQSEVLQSGNEMLVAVRSFLSSSANIWSLTAVVEFFVVISNVLIWKWVDVPLSSQGGDKGLSLAIPYTAFSSYQTSAFWLTLLHWALPSLILPSIVGTLISFNPATTPRTGGTPAPIAPFDPLTASIVRVAAQIAYPYPALNQQIIGIDVLGFRWRVLGASLGLAFAFAEAIAGAPQRFASTLMKERRAAIGLEEEGGSPSPRERRALTAEATVIGEIE